MSVESRRDDGNKIPVADRKAIGAGRWVVPVSVKLDPNIHAGVIAVTDFEEVVLTEKAGERVIGTARV